MARKDIVYYLRPSNDPCFFPGMCAEVVLRKTGDSVTEHIIGVLGVVHPEVLAKYAISYPCSIIELDIEAII